MLLAATHERVLDGTWSRRRNAIHQRDFGDGGGGGGGNGAGNNFGGSSKGQPFGGNGRGGGFNQNKGGSFESDNEQNGEEDSSRNGSNNNNGNDDSGDDGDDEDGSVRSGNSGSNNFSKDSTVVRTQTQTQTPNTSVNRNLQPATIAASPSTNPVGVISTKTATFTVSGQSSPSASGTSGDPIPSPTVANTGSLFSSSSAHGSNLRPNSGIPLGNQVPVPSISVIVSKVDAQSMDSGLPPGAIVGIVFAGIFAVGLVAFFFIRWRARRRRLHRRTNVFPPFVADQNPTETAVEGPITSRFSGHSLLNAFPPVTAVEVASSPSKPRPLPIPPIPAKVASVSPSRGTSMKRNKADVSPMASPLGLSSPSTDSFLRNTMVCKRAFQPSLPDELSMAVGDVMRVMAMYDDGWAFCVNETGQQGMVPLKYLEGGLQSLEDYRLSRANSALLAAIQVL